MAESVTPLPEPKQAIPEVVEIDATAGFPLHSPRETSMLRQLTGKSFDQLMGANADDGDRERVMAWLTLRRLGFDPSWEDTHDILIRIVTPTPLGDASLQPSPDSAGSGE